MCIPLLDICAFRFLINPCRFSIVLWGEALSASWVRRLFAYYVKCEVMAALEPVKLVTAALSYAVDRSRLANISSIPTISLAPYLPWHEVCWHSYRSAWASMKWDQKYFQFLSLSALQSLHDADKLCLYEWISFCYRKICALV